MLKPDIKRDHLAYFARHPRLTETCEHLAAMSEVTPARAVAIVQAACRDAGITQLDLEMVQPGAGTAVPFSPATTATPADQHNEMVSHHVRKLMEARTR